MSPENTLVVMIEAAAALAGFAGIIATLKRESWTQLDSLQIQNLLSCTFSALFISILALILLHAEVPEALAWQILSATWFAAGLVATAGNALAYRRFGRATGQVYLSMANVFWFASALAVLALQVYNVISGEAFWPVLVGISWLFALACYSFWQLLIRHQ